MVSDWQNLVKCLDNRASSETNLNSVYRTNTTEMPSLLCQARTVSLLAPIPVSVSS
jgi:hypothetical protein